MKQELIPGIQPYYDQDLRGKRVMVSLSGGINSAAVLCYLASEYYPEYKPDKVYLFYAHLKEHSPGTARFVVDQIRYAKCKFQEVVWEYTSGSVLAFFQKDNFIPHPAFSPCSDHLKQIPVLNFIKKHSIDIDLIGYVVEEKRRIKRQERKGIAGKGYPISSLSNENCFDLVAREIGWYPAIYDIKRDNGDRVFKHNNCLPCKNMQGSLMPDGSHSGEYSDVAKYFPEYYKRAAKLSFDIDSYWGRDADFDGHCKFCEFS